MGARVTVNVVLRDPKTGQPVPLCAGDDLPEWADVDAALVEQDVEQVEASDATDDVPTKRRQARR